MAAASTSAAPSFEDMPCLDLPRHELQHWNGMLFNGKRQVAKDLAKLGVAKELDFEGYMLNKVETVEYDFNWKTFIEVYLEDYHVGPFHPGLGRFVTCDDLKWEFGDWHSVQTVGVNQRLGTPGSDTYKNWHDAGAQLQERRAAAARRDLAHLLPERDGRVVSARARDLDALSARARRSA
jgi:phenylpropionate dioxygenase-like ring-hydroxylating dioxygenase large terminal subunit